MSKRARKVILRTQLEVRADGSSSFAFDPDDPCPRTGNAALMDAIAKFAAEWVRREQQEEVEPPLPPYQHQITSDVPALISERAQAEMLAVLDRCRQSKEDAAIALLPPEARDELEDLIADGWAVEVYGGAAGCPVYFDLFKPRGGRIVDCVHFAVFEPATPEQAAPA
jgi:hypothetical protein